jgi:hypothetical protein
VLPDTSGLASGPKELNQHGENDETPLPELINETAVLMRFIAIHVAWSGILVLLKDDTFRGGLHKPDGQWKLEGDVLTLKWYHWPESKLRSDRAGGYVSLRPEDDLSLQEYDPTKAKVYKDVNTSTSKDGQDPLDGRDSNGGIYLNLGCGGNILPPPWRNYDMDMDITKPLPLADSSVSAVFVEHTIEHIDGPSCLRFFDECHRILKPGGVLRVCVPAIPQLCGKHLRDIILNHGHKSFFCDMTLHAMFLAAGFDINKIEITDRKKCDGHWRIIGEELDRLETCRMEAIK